MATAEGNRYTFTGREWDEELELYHYRARMYDPLSGRFCSRDPIGFDGSKWNTYEYVSGSPLVSLDPTGKFQPAIHPGIPLPINPSGPRGPDPTEPPDYTPDLIVGATIATIIICRGNRNCSQGCKRALQRLKRLLDKVTVHGLD